jgi:quinol monooxygenase YgiN
MIIVTVKGTPKSEYKQDFISAFKTVSELVYKEEGCIEYEIYQKDKESNDLFIFERWESKEALNAHLKTKHMEDFFAKVSTWFDRENDMQVYEVK